MREIKFRGYGKDAKRWIYGSLLDERAVGIVAIQDDDCHVWEVDPESVGQFTGMKDCEGREIYEGDVIQVVTKNPYWAFKKNYDVYWDLDGFCLEGEPLYYWFKLHDLKVIGNAHDNPELLERMI